MKNNKKWLFKSFSLAVFAVCVLFASCEMFSSSDVVNAQRDVSVSEMTFELDRRGELALLHSAESHVTSREKLQDIVVEMLSSEDDSGQNRSRVTGVHSYSVVIEDGFSSVTANRRPEAARKERSQIDFHVFYLDDDNEQGFAFTCADDRIGNLLALVPNGDFHRRYCRYQL